MKNNKVVFISDFNLRGSGYLNISVPLCRGLADRGFDVKAVGLGYTGEEHPFNFSIIPCQSFSDAHAMTNNLFYQWKPDVVVIAMDIPYLQQFASLCKGLGIKMVAITPLENPPLTITWAYILQQIDKVFFISQLGTDEALKAGVESEHLFVGMDTVSWRMRTPDEYIKGREMMGISPETMVILTVADNQERKNLSKAFETVSKLKKRGVKVKYILVTRENSDVGWKLRDMGMYYGIASEVMIFERGISFKELYSLYAISDAFLLCSKAEGLCMPVMEAMSVGIPVVSTRCGAITELLANERGLLMDTSYPTPEEDMIDPWGNELRVFPSSTSGADLLERIHRGKDGSGSPTLMTRAAREYMESRNWETPVNQLVNALEKLHETAE